GRSGKAGREVETRSERSRPVRCVERSGRGRRRRGCAGLGGVDEHRASRTAAGTRRRGVCLRRVGPGAERLSCSLETLNRKEGKAARPLLRRTRKDELSRRDLVHQAPVSIDEAGKSYADQS